MEQYYSDALKLGQKCIKACAAKGEPEELPVLDEILQEKRPAGEKDQGLVQIPMELVVGTKTAGRANLFAPNFMPLAPEQSECAAKWERLCLSHLDEGIREPIKAYEYRMIPYLLADNPSMSQEEAFALSREMMKGQKWKTFVLDLSFIGWDILSIFTGGILSMFYVQPYKMMTNAALYEALAYGTPAAPSDPAV